MADNSLLFTDFLILMIPSWLKEPGPTVKAKLHAGAYSLAQLTNELALGTCAGTVPKPTGGLGEASAQTSQRARGRAKGGQPLPGVFLTFLQLRHTVSRGKSAFSIEKFPDSTQGDVYGWH